MLDKANPLPQLNTPTNGSRISVQQRHVPKETPPQIKNGSLVETLIGGRPKNDLKAFLDTKALA